MATFLDESDAPVAVITGAGRGIGRATAVELADRGYRLVLVGRSRTDLETVAEACAGDTAVVVADLTDTATLEPVIAAAAEGFGRLDALVNNAGLAPSIGFEQTDDTTLRTTLEVNLIGPFILSRLAWPHLRRANGMIINLSSLSADDPFDGFSAYAAAKAGINGLTVALAKEGAADGIRCIAVAPGGVETEMFRALPFGPDVPAEALLAPEDVATVIAEAITGSLAYASGEVIRLRKSR